jgi:isoquinoline 1-oxidoreductase subunit beta
MLQKHPRHAAVLKLAAEKAGWLDGKPAGGRMRGVAMHESFSSYVANVPEVSVNDNGSVKVERVVCAIDCGVGVNPDVVAAQMEGGLGYGLGAALKGEITMKDGVVQQSNFEGYDVLRISEMPKVEVYIVLSAEAPTCVGEPATPVIAPAVANALLSGRACAPPCCDEQAEIQGPVLRRGASASLDAAAAIDLDGDAGDEAARGVSQK